MIGGQTVPTHAMAKQLPLSQDVLCTRRSPVVCPICLSGSLRRLRLATIDRHVSLLHANKKKQRYTCKPSPCPKKNKVLWQSGHYGYNISAAQRIPGVMSWH